MAEVLDVRADGRASAVERAGAALRDGELIVLPTDTVYGLAADAFNVEGTARLFAAKHRDRKVPLPVLVRSPKQLVGLTPTVPEAAERLVAAYWPGALTLVLPCEPNVRWDLGRTDGALAVRMPLDDVALEVIRAVGPLAVTSANRAGGPVGDTAQEVAVQLGDAVAVYLDDGPRTAVAGSTVLDLTRREPRILRRGGVDPDRALAVARGELDPLEAAAEEAAPDETRDDLDG